MEANQKQLEDFNQGSLGDKIKKLSFKLDRTMAILSGELEKLQQNQSRILRLLEIKHKVVEPKMLTGKKAMAFKDGTLNFFVDLPDTPMQQQLIADHCRKFAAIYPTDAIEVKYNSKDHWAWVFAGTKEGVPMLRLRLKSKGHPSRFKRVFKKR